MMKKYLLTLGLVLATVYCKSQHYSMFNTRTMFDGFENPAAKTFVLDSSYKYASNFFFPNLSVVAANRGSAQDVIKRLVTEGKFSAEGVPLVNGLPNRVFETSNVYLFTFKIFNHFRYQQELGFSWQVRSDAKVDYTNETLAVMDSYKRFTDAYKANGDVPYFNIFNNDGYQQSYHQFSFSIRENWDKRLAFGAKVSLLSGIAYNELDIDHSYMYVDAVNDRLDVGLAGKYRGTFIDKQDINTKNFIPTFKSPGVSLSMGTTYQSRSGYFIMANLKDLGFIRWRKGLLARFNKIESFYGSETNTSREISDRLLGFIEEGEQEASFTVPTNAKVDFTISRTFDFYRPSLIASKFLFHEGGDVAFVNTFKFNSFSASITPAYNFNKFFMLGIQGMYQTPNFEFFLGTDNLGKSISFGRGLNQSDATIGTGYLGASVYMGLGIKFGNVVNHPMNLSQMPGVDGQKPYRGFFRSLFSIFGAKQY